ncbi:zinc finger domain-containing protein [Trichoderma chlorosporum]
MASNSAETSGLTGQDLDLHYMLSLQRQTPTAAQSQDTTNYRKIGAGACGAVFAQDGKSFVIKLGKSDNEILLWNDYHKHTLIAKHFQKWVYTGVKIPECYFFVPRDDPLYFDKNPELAEAAKDVCHLPTSALVTQRIWPLPELTRTFLIDKYCAPRIKEAAFADPANQDCLVRVYLGSMNGRSGGMFFSLRNFKMHLNQMIDIKLDIPAMASRIGSAMAILHWSAGTDARDVEFVLGSSANKVSAKITPQAIAKFPQVTYTGPESRITEDFFARTTELWVLDFNQVRPITMDAAGVAKAVEAATINDPYLPKPLGESHFEQLAWDEFTTHYIMTADMILGEEDPELMVLPRMFIRGLIEVQENKK